MGNWLSGHWQIVALSVIAFIIYTAILFFIFYRNSAPMRKVTRFFHRRKEAPWYEYLSH